MNTSPSIDDLLEGVIISIGDDLVPSLNDAKAHATAAMIQSILQGVRQMLPVRDERLADEHNAMTATLRDTAAVLGDVSGDAADRIRQRASTLGHWPDLPMPGDLDRIIDAHRQLGQALIDTMIDLDHLQRAGEPRADAAVDVIHATSAPAMFMTSPRSRSAQACSVAAERIRRSGSARRALRFADDLMDGDRRTASADHRSG